MTENVIGNTFCGKIPQSLEAPYHPENILETVLISPFSQESSYISFNSYCKILLGEHNGMCTCDTFINDASMRVNML
jgi:hypothetical protein